MANNTNSRRERACHVPFTWRRCRNVYVCEELPALSVCCDEVWRLWPGARGAARVGFSWSNAPGPDTRMLVRHVPSACLYVTAAAAWAAEREVGFGEWFFPHAPYCEGSEATDGVVTLTQSQDKAVDLIPEASDVVLARGGWRQV